MRTDIQMAEIIYAKDQIINNKINNKNQNNNNNNNIIIDEDNNNDQSPVSSHKPSSNQAAITPVTYCDTGLVSEELFDEDKESSFSDHNNDNNNNNDIMRNVDNHEETDDRHIQRQDNDIVEDDENTDDINCDSKHSGNKNRKLSVLFFPEFARDTTEDKDKTEDETEDDAYGILSLQSFQIIRKRKRGLSFVDDVIEESKNVKCSPLPPLTRMQSVRVRASAVEVIIHFLGIMLCFISIVFCCVEFIGMIPDLEPSAQKSGGGSASDLCRRYEAKIAAFADSELEIETELEED